MTQSHQRLTAGQYPSVSKLVISGYERNIDTRKYVLDKRLLKNLALGNISGNCGYYEMIISIQISLDVKMVGDQSKVVQFTLI
jgi:hypothetical protein